MPEATIMTGGKAKQRPKRRPPYPPRKPVVGEFLTLRDRKTGKVLATFRQIAADLCR